MEEKKYKLKEEHLKQLVPGMGGCFATDKITVDGMKVGYMYRDEPDSEDEGDSGWCFFSGTEDEEYLNNEENLEFYGLNEIANYDPAIIPYLNSPVGTQLERVEGTDEFKEVVPEEEDFEDEE